MLFTVKDTGEAVVLKIEGELDAVTVAELRPIVDRLANDARGRVVVDLSALRLIDSSGVGALVSLFKQVRARGGEVVVENVKDQPLAIFRLLRLDKVLMAAA
jgi:anti-sigma B factor antagonist